MSTRHQIDKQRLTAMSVCVMLALYASNLQAQSETDIATGKVENTKATTTLDSVEVIGKRRTLASFPGSITVIDGETLRDGQQKVNLSESLIRVPGITVLDRQNYAQDLQVQSRGFGARSTFGIRGIKLIADGIPASAADGQGQAGSFTLDALDRIEVLRGPLALQYGNAAGGAIVAYTDLETRRGNSVDFWFGENASYRLAAGLDGASSDDTAMWRINASRFANDGERLHSAVERSQLNAIAQWNLREGEHIRLVINSLSQPETQDPLGLTRVALNMDPHGTDAVALAFNTRKSIENHQLGLQWENIYETGRRVWAGVYHIERDIEQFLAIPMGAQIPAGSAGGVVDLGRRSDGINVGHEWSGARGAFVIGMDASELDEARRGYENFVGSELGVRGRLRRDEDNHVSSREIYAIGDWKPNEEWSMLAAVRYSHLGFISDDHYLAPGNGDDSGRLDYKQSSASFGVARTFTNGEIFASIGRGFETPTITELAYRPDGVAGINFGLTPAHFVSTEIGARWHTGDFKHSVSFYHVTGEDEIVPADSRGGRASFANAGRTNRIGLEFGSSGKLGNHWSYALAANWIRARFDESFSYNVFINGNNVVRTVEAGNRIPGIPRADAYAELMWRSSSNRFGTALEARFSDSIVTDDRNTDYAGGYARFALRIDWRPANSSDWNGFVRLDNILDRRYVGSVIVNEGNSRFFEPGAGRGITVGFGWHGSAKHSGLSPTE
ncbi:MAG: TonB-dependent receptor family protein [Arenimonas sp.]